jgi:phosphoribosylformylglycinamidine (FGAM) synthase-like amidotransferase family enzyme
MAKGVGMKEVKALVLAGNGINSEREMLLACRLAGLKASLLHMNYLFSGQHSLNTYDLLLMPGGFSHGDELGAGTALAVKLLSVKEQLKSFVEEGKCILAVGNGFQALLKLGLLGEGCCSFASNDSGQFETRWKPMQILESPSVFTRDLEELFLPFRCGEGKIVTENPALKQSLFDEKRVVAVYEESGSAREIAALCDSTGRILGMMPHPEMALSPYHDPHWARKREILDQEGRGMCIFNQLIDYLRNKERESKKLEVYS